MNNDSLISKVLLESRRDEGESDCFLSRKPTFCDLSSGKTVLTFWYSFILSVSWSHHETLAQHVIKMQNLVLLAEDCFRN